MRDGVPVEFGLLGPLQITCDGVEVVLPAGKHRSLLAGLLLRPNRVVQVSEMIRWMWDDDPPGNARATTQTYVGRLRRALGDGLITTRPDGYMVNIPVDRLDVVRFDGLVEQARQAADPADASRRLSEALALWRGPALADVPSEVLQREEVPALAERRLRALERRIELDLQAGRHPDLVAELQLLTAEHPLRERFWAQLMTALAGSGRQAEALCAYDDLRTRLADELGADPGPELQELHRAVLRGGGAPTPTAAPSQPPPDAPPVVPAQLPADVAGFTGRTHQLRRLAAFMAAGGAAATHPAPVVVAVVEGTAGVGKTALAVHWAHSVRDRFPDGQLYVDLRGYAAAAPLAPAEVLVRFLHAFGVPAPRIPHQQDAAAALYRSILADRRVLVVLDNAATADQVRPLLPGGSGCLVVVTSRDRLSGLVARDGAHRVTLDVLTPEEARALLAAVIGDQRVTAEPQAAAELGRLCGHLPLALRIAAANLAVRPHLTVAAQVAELTGGRQLAGLRADNDERTTVQAAFDLSYARLPAAVQRTFRLLGLAPGPDITPAAAAALAGIAAADAQRSVDRMTAAHLLEQPTSGRYRFHDLLRAYARQRSSTEDSAADRRAAVDRVIGWYVQSARAAGDTLYPQILRLPAASSGPTPARFEGADQARSWLDAELPNLTAAIRDAARSGRREAAWLLADALRGFLYLRRHLTIWPAVAGDGLAAAEAAGDQPATAACRLSVGDLNLVAGQYFRAIEQYSAALAAAATADWPEAAAAAHGNLGIAYRSLGRLRQAAAHHAEALALYRRSARRGGEAVTLGNLGVVCEDLGQLRQAAHHTTQALELFRQLGSRPAEANALGNLGRLERKLGRPRTAAEHLTAALALHREVGQRSGEATALDDLAALANDTGAHRDALDHALAALTVSRNIDDSFCEAATLNTLGATHLHLGAPPEATEAHQRALALARRTDDRLHEIAALLGLAAVQRHIGQSREALANASHALTLASGTNHLEWEGHAQTSLARTYLARSDMSKAVNHARLALAIHHQTGHQAGQALTRSILDLAGFTATQGMATPERGQPVIEHAVDFVTPPNGQRGRNGRTGLEK